MTNPQVTTEFMIHVDRKVKPIYPEFVKEVMHPELELTGPIEYDLGEVGEWCHNDQKSGKVSGHIIYKHLKTSNALATCLNLQDGLAIQKKGTAVFRKLFGRKSVYLWGSVVRDRGTYLNVPCLYGSGGKMELYWYWLGSDWSSFHPALRFGK